MPAPRARVSLGRMGEGRLGKDVFVALAAIGWADGKLDADEADAIVRTAVDEGLELDEITSIEEATKNGASLDALERGTMSKADRLFVYAVACWIANMDGKVTTEETSALAKLGERLGVPERPRAAAESIAREVAQMPEGDRPARYDLPRVRKLIGDRLKQSAGG